MKIVKFKNGKYGIRRHSVFFVYEFCDLRADGTYWWETNSLNKLKYSEGNLDDVIKLCEQLKDNGKPI